MRVQSTLKCQVSCFASTTQKTPKRRISWANVDFDAAQLQWDLVESQVQQRWRCSRDPIYTTKHKQNFSILTHCKNKDFNWTSEHRLTWIAVLDFNGAQKNNVSPATVAAGPTHLSAEKNRKNICKLYAMITIQRCHKKYLHPGNWMLLGKLKSWQCNNAKKLPFPYFTLFIWNPATNRTKI